MVMNCKHAFTKRENWRVILYNRNVEDCFVWHHMTTLWVQARWQEAFPGAAQLNMKTSLSIWSIS
jgi:hypothetical protein